MYDYTGGKWPSANAHSIGSDEYEALSTAFSYNTGDALKSLESILQETDKASHLDEMLNSMYLADRVLLPPKRFAALKVEQKAWLAKRDAAKSTEEKFKIIGDRIDALYRLIYPE